MLQGPLGEIAVVVNKFDLNVETTRSLHRTAETHGATVLGGIPFDREVPRMLAQGKSPLAVPAVGDALQRIWRHIEKTLED